MHCHWKTLSCQHALATEDPEQSLLLEAPHGRNEPLISPTMWVHLATQASYQIIILFLIIYAAPTTIDRYRLPTAQTTYSSVDARGIDLTGLNSTSGNLLYNPIPNKSYSVKAARCEDVPCIHICCHVDTSTGHCIDNLLSQGGHYLPGEVPLCGLGERNAAGIVKVAVQRARGKAQNFCAGQSDMRNCQRFQTFKHLDERANEQFHADTKHTREDANSLVFNTFIFLQVFNEINARKIKNEKNLLAGLWKSRTFMYIWFIIVGLQLVIMMTPVRIFFKVRYQTWEEWLFAIGAGAGCVPVSLATRILSPPLLRAFANYRSTHKKSSVHPDPI